jgi:hypothetical protein
MVKGPEGMLIVYSAELTALLVYPDFTASALTFVVTAIEIGVV